ncbi:hypothetical protein [Ideonella alba]|uniref:Uncharacterized protein n=1 Tax=Ideonella alba TaxID=2824118 RepID=A0A940Y6P0_9BURK|nr:hypothetical protein [Ideonella alba]MBQ0929758.1 hypothetical protein [Ideonella alba]
MPWQKDLATGDLLATQKGLAQALQRTTDQKERLNILGALRSIAEVGGRTGQLTPEQVVGGPGAWDTAIDAGAFGGSNGSVPPGISRAPRYSGPTNRSAFRAYEEEGMGPEHNAAQFEKLRDDLRAQSRPGYRFSVQADGAQRYTYGSLNQGHGIDGYLSPDGVLRLEVQASPSPTTRFNMGTGTEMFEGMMAKFGPENVQQINGTWSRSSGLTSNLDSFEANFARTGDKFEAAAQTWTGQRAASYGFIPVKVDITSDGPRVIFRRPPQ